MGCIPLGLSFPGGDWALTGLVHAIRLYQSNVSRCMCACTRHIYVHVFLHVHIHTCILADFDIGQIIDDIIEVYHLSEEISNTSTTYNTEYEPAKKSVCITMTELPSEAEAINSLAATLKDNITTDCTERTSDTICNSDSDGLLEQLTILAAITDGFASEIDVAVYIL